MAWYESAANGTLKTFVRSNPVYQRWAFVDKNVLEGKHSRSMLLSYINEPFRAKNIYRGHSNRRQALIIAKVFDELGFNVDVFNYRYNKSIDYSKYDVIFGFGEPFEKSFYAKSPAKKIYYATGAYFVQRNLAEIQRIVQSMKRGNPFLPPRRIKEYPELLSVALSDAIICTGNEWTVDTYRRYSEGPFYQIPIGVYYYPKESSPIRDYAMARKNFLWMGGHGLMLKGLDLALDAFQKCPNNILHICGPMEPDFAEAFKNKLSMANVIYHGFIDVCSREFQEICASCAYVISPSASEGGSGSVLTAMRHGLIPIITTETGVDINAYCMKISDNLTGIINTVQHASDLSIDDLDLYSKQSIDYVAKHHTFESYEVNLRKILDKLLATNMTGR